MSEVVLIQVEAVLLMKEVVVGGASRSEEDNSHCNAFSSRLDAEASDPQSLDVSMIGINKVCHKPTTLLGDLGSTYSYMSTYFYLSLEILCESLDLPVYISTHVGDSLVVH